MRHVHLKASILMLLVLLLLLASFLINLVFKEGKLTENDYDSKVKALQAHYQSIIKKHTQQLEAALIAVLDNSELRLALKTENREALLTRAYPLFEKLKIRHRITHLYFNNEQRTNLLRVHQPEHYGDVINRFTMLEAERSGEITSGVELGALGTFVLRVVAPIYEDSQIQGYIELGKEVGALLNDMAQDSGNEFVIVLEKRFLNRVDWETGMRMLNREYDWSHLPEIVVASQTLAADTQTRGGRLLQSIDNQLSGPVEIILNEQRYRADTITLQDANSQNIGKLMMLHDAPVPVHNNYLTIFLILSGTALLGGVLFTILFFLVDRVGRRNKNADNGITDREQRMKLHYQQTPLGVIEWDTDFRVIDWNPAAERIFGYTKSEAIGQHASFIIPNHEIQAVDIVWQELLNKQDWVHQVNENNTKEGQIRLCEWYNTPLVDTSGRVMGAASLVDDITEKRKVELLSAHMGRIFEQSWNEIYTFNANTLNFIEASVGACQNLGYSMNELKQLTPVDIKPEFTVERFEAMLEPLRKGKQQTITFETEHQRKDGSRYSVEVRLQLSSLEGPPIYIAIIQDISERKLYIADLEHKALYDTLTDLPNRALLHDRLKHSLKVASRDTLTLAVVIVDVARLGEVNDLLGHQSGDIVMQDVAYRLRNELRESDTVARLAGDEFVLVLSGVDSKQIGTVADKIQLLFEQPLVVNDVFLEIEVAIGIALYPNHGDDPDLLLQHADIAMRIAKSDATGYSIYTPEDDPFSLQRLKLHGEIRQAISENEFVLYYQPKIDIKSNRIISVEALARWPHPENGIIAPNDFIPMIEQSGLIRPFTFWVLKQAIEQCKHWANQGIDINIAVNLSTRNLLDPELPGKIFNLLELYNVNPACLTLEITESAVMTRPEHALKILTQLNKMGLKLSIDDFGTGYSSLASLKKLPVTELKIDQSFVFGLTTNQDDAIIVRSTIDLAHNLGIHAVAEGVESQAALDQLALLNCDIAQGYLMGRPMPIEELNDWLNNSTWGIHS